jgi:hypothetical protein
VVVHLNPTRPLREGANTPLSQGERESAVAKALADESVFAKASTRQGGPRNMRFCETNRIGNVAILDVYIRAITGYDDSMKFLNPVRLESFSAGSE